MARQPRRTKIELNGFKKGDDVSKLAVYAADRSRKVIEMAEVDEKGYFNLSGDALKKANQVLIGPAVDNLQSADKRIFTSFRVSQFKKVLQTSATIDISKNNWSRWRWFKRCVNGDVKHCYPWPILVNQFMEKVAFAKTTNITSISRKSGTRSAMDASIAEPAVASAIAKPSKSAIWPFKCNTVCDGLVEVYRRICCCHPWIIYDERLPDLLYELEKLVPEIPELRWPPIPDPDPGPWRSLVKNGALDELAINAPKDLKALKSLPPDQVASYINARPYLFCLCGSAKKVAQGIIRSDGEFHICWREWPILMRVNCHEDYAYVVKQNVDGETSVIYDGVAAHQWYHYSDDPTLVSYHRDAISCRKDPFPDEEGAFVLLQDIGLTGTYNLETPDASGWNSVDSPDYNDGLAFPAVNADAAKGKLLNRNWGGKLLLRAYFSDAMKDVGAKYYRISVVKANSSGDPSGDRTYLPVSQWRYYEVIGSDIFVRKVALGPDSKGDENHLYEIPYDSDERDWQSGQYHAVLDTRDYANGRFLLTIEIFDDSGNLLRPNGTEAPDDVNSNEAGFTFRRWYQETGPMANVPFAALTHMLWWDNRRTIADIVDLRKDGAASDAECQFIFGNADSNFSVGYRAYHPEPMFLLNHRLWWRRGLNGPYDYMTIPNYDPNYVGMPPDAPHPSHQHTFGHMLDGHPKCAFTVNLHSNIKTFNGIGTLHGLEGWDQAAFALDVSGLCIPIAEIDLEAIRSKPLLDRILTDRK